MNHMESDGWWLSEYYKYDDITFISTCCDAHPTHENVEVDEDGIGFGHCSKCNEWSDFYDENE
tara:strand:+ start:1037 stop:1225 length:189 start_codon:yes stop_codon:yes gene_type:complete